MDHYLSLRDVADRTGISHNTLKTWAGRRQWDRLPEPDAVIGLAGAQRTVYGWRADTIEAWHHS